jgi:hypothetical protein
MSDTDESSSAVEFKWYVEDLRRQCLACFKELPDDVSASSLALSRVQALIANARPGLDKKMFTALIKKDLVVILDKSMIEMGYGPTFVKLKLQRDMIDTYL